MIRYLYASDLMAFPDLAADMFRDRAAQFRDRMGWDVTVDSMGWETDIYDGTDPLYIIAEDGIGGHAGSMRFLPTTGPVMVNDVFAHLTGTGAIRSPAIWETTRFCLSPGAGTMIARRLLLAASELGLGFGLSHAIGVFDAPMIRVYRRLGWEPRILGTQDGISAGMWTFADATHDRLCAAVDVHPGQSRHWFDQALGHLPLPVGA
ncbi:acyl-homoserine-lactone synthase [Jannaschia sp. 2305UL9-9]|uniref:acyl-homoserine-lactone synthase n=1 Tax=Jannaschia sp. 2305UL9-9 TaxID=3121638 RepID=UPI003527E659